MNYIDPECDYGNVEYKYTLINLNNNIIQGRATQLDYRLNEGMGQAFLYIGVMDNGCKLGILKEHMEESLKNVNKILNIIDAKITEKNVEEISASIDISNDNKLMFLYNNCKDLFNTPYRKLDNISNYKELTYDRYIVKLSLARISNTKKETRIVVIGNVDSGKSSLVGVLTKQVYDDGNGLARSAVFNHPHELKSGRTSSIGIRLIGYDQDKKIVNKIRDTSKDIVDKSTKLICLYDLAGHLQYLRTTVTGVCNSYADFALVIVGANMGITEMTKEHIRLAYLHHIPLAIIFTKIDIAPIQVYHDNIVKMKSLLKGANYQPIYIKTMDDVDYFKQIFTPEVVPIISISNVTGEGHDVLTRLLHEIPKKYDFGDKLREPFYYTISEIFTVPGIGTVVSGMALSGNIKSRTSHWIGPYYDNSFKKVFIKSIQYKRVNVDSCQADQSITFAIRGESKKDEIKRDEIKKGMTIIDGSLPEPKGYQKFLASVTIVGRHSTTVRENYEAVINCSNIRQTAKIIKIRDIKSKIPCQEDEDGKHCLRGGDTATIEMMWKFSPVYAPCGSIFIFRENKIKGHGKILEILD